jgi:vitamin B12 transporter
MLLFLLFSFTGLAQQIPIDTSKQLKAVEVSASRLTIFANSTKTEMLDSTLLNRYSTGNLADLLANESQIFIKSYGLGSLATTSFRGAGASHTAILWNGFNVQSPMNGLVDMALIPANFMNNVKIQYGGDGALWGSGAVGGSIHLNNHAEYNKGITVAMNTALGSFADQQQQANVEISKKQWITSLKVFNHTAKNDFPFINTAQYGKPLQKQANAELNAQGILQENYFQLNARQKINTHFWYQFNDRNIPPSMTQNVSTAKQKDVCYRATVEWQRTTDRLTVLVRAAYFDEYLFYIDSSIQIDSKSRTKVAIAEAETRFHIFKFDLINIGVNNTYSEARTEDYVSNPHQNRAAIFANYKVHTPNDSWSAVLSGRQEFIENNAVPFTPSLGLKGKFLRYFFIKGNVAKHYRVPTFNDLYWSQGGNPNLKPESGWSEEISLEHKYAAKIVGWELSATAFNRNIEQWIIWLPNNYGIWSPENVLQVQSRGLEYKWKVNMDKNKFHFQFSGLYNYILSTNEKATTTNDPSLGKQLIYVPIQNAQATFTIGYKGTAITYTQVYTGYRYTLSDNSKYLKPYTVGNIHISQTFLSSHSKIKIFLQLNNVWNESYQILAYRAMPLMSYQFGLAITLNQPNKK